MFIKILLFIYLCKCYTKSIAKCTDNLLPKLKFQYSISRISMDEELRAILHNVIYKMELNLRVVAQFLEEVS